MSSIRISHSPAPADAWLVKADTPIAFSAHILLSDKLATFLGLPFGTTITRQDLTKAIVHYTKDKGLRDESIKVRLDETLADLLGLTTADESVTILNIQRHLRPLYKTQTEIDFETWWTTAGRPTNVNVGFVEKPYMNNYISLYNMVQQASYSQLSFTVYTNLGDQNVPCGCGVATPCFYHDNSRGLSEDCVALCGCSRELGIVCDYHL